MNICPLNSLILLTRQTIGSKHILCLPIGFAYMCPIARWWLVKTKRAVFKCTFAMLIDQIINLYVWTLLAYLATGWLVAFKIINPWQPIVRMVIDALSRIHEPLLRPWILPDFGALDVSPIVLFLLAQFFATSSSLLSA